MPTIHFDCSITDGTVDRGRRGANLDAADPKITLPFLGPITDLTITLPGPIFKTSLAMAIPSLGLILMSVLDLSYMTGIP